MVSFPSFCSFGDNSVLFRYCPVQRPFCTFLLFSSFSAILPSFSSAWLPLGGGGLLKPHSPLLHACDSEFGVSSLYISNLPILLKGRLCSFLSCWWLCCLSPTPNSYCSIWPLVCTWLCFLYLHYPNPKFILLYINISNYCWVFYWLILFSCF